jgi:chromosome segregation ATPase
MDELRQNGHVPLEHIRASFAQSLSDGTEARQVVTDMFTKVMQLGQQLSTCTTEVELNRIHIDELRTELQHERELRQATESKLSEDLRKHAAESRGSRDLLRLEEEILVARKDMDSSPPLDFVPGSPKSDPRRARNDGDLKMLRQQLSKLDVKLAAVKRTSDDTSRLRSELAEGMDRIARQAVGAAREAAEEKCKTLKEMLTVPASRESTVDEVARNGMDELGASHSQLLETLASQNHRLELLNARIEDMEGKRPPRQERRQSRPEPQERRQSRPEPLPVVPPVLHIRRRGLDIFDCEPRSQRD